MRLKARRTNFFSVSGTAVSANFPDPVFGFTTDNSSDKFATRKKHRIPFSLGDFSPRRKDKQ